MTALLDDDAHPLGCSVWDTPDPQPGCCTPTGACPVCERTATWQIGDTAACDIHLAHVLRHTPGDGFTPPTPRPIGDPR